MADNRGNSPPDVRRRWRYYRTDHGAEPVRAYLDGLAPADRAVVVARMRLVREQGARAGRRLGHGLLEVGARRGGREHRVVFAREGRRQQVLLALDAFDKGDRRTPPERMRVAERRLREWRDRGGRQLERR